MKFLKKAVQTHKPIKVLVGTCLGSKQDTEALARSQIDRYFDIPGNSWMLIRQVEKVHVYEIHEGGSGKPYLPNILKAMKGQAESVFLKALGGKPIQVIRRDDGYLSTLMLPSNTTPPDGHVEVDVDITGKMKPYATTGAEWNRIGLASLSLGVLMMTISGVVSKSFDIAMQGYHEVASTLPISRIAELSFHPKSAGDTVKPLESLPASQWAQLFETPLNSGESISRLVYQSGKWEVQKVSAEEDGEPGEIEIRHPLDVEQLTQTGLSGVATQEPHQ